jgi:transcriptional regulator with XRE-family HTH domain
VRVNGPVIRNLRSYQGFNGAEFARQCEISPQYLSDLERGKRIGAHPAVVKRIAEALGVPMRSIVMPETEAVGA